MAPRKEKEVAQNEKPQETTVEFLSSIAGVLVTGLFIITFVLQAFEIPSSSMEDTLLIGDHVFVNREQFAAATHWMGPQLPYRSIRRGDIVVFLSPEEPGLFVVKRIVGVPGDRIHVRDGALYRNGEKLVEPYVQHKIANYDPSRDNFPAVPPSEMYGVTSQDWQNTLHSYVRGEDVVVPPNSYFGMGDNRDVSKDSRYWGFIPPSVSGPRRRSISRRAPANSAPIPHRAACSASFPRPRSSLAPTRRPCANRRSPGRRCPTSRPPFRKHPGATPTRLRSLPAHDRREKLWTARAWRSKYRLLRALLPANPNSRIHFDADNSMQS